MFQTVAAAIAGLPVLLFPATATPASGTIQFGGNITYSNSCSIVVGAPGTITPNADSTQLSSKNAGGQQGVADIYSIHRYDISVSSPDFFTNAPSGGNDNATFTTTFSGESLHRGRTFSERPGDSPVRLRNGYSITRVFVDLEADRTDSFPSGNYTAVAIVRCE
ncbi:MAG: hypothetical protein KDJ69_13985 [Nitratireductor sp.]|nr:hypothetical protein [Nitratireductor sp.]